jgi:hypothetical protein
MYGWRTRGFKPFNEEALAYFRSVGVDPTDVIPSGFTESFVRVRISGLEVRGWLPKEFDFEEFKAIADLEPNSPRRT